MSRADCFDCSRSLAERDINFQGIGSGNKKHTVILCSSCAARRQAAQGGNKGRCRCPACGGWKSLQAKICLDCSSQMRQIRKRARQAAKLFIPIQSATEALSEDIRDDVRSLLYVDALDGTIDTDGLESRLRFHKRAVCRQMRSDGFILRLDAATKSDDGERIYLRDTIIDERSSDPLSALADWWERRASHWPFYGRSVAVSFGFYSRR